MPDVLLVDLSRPRFALWSKPRTVREELAEGTVALPTP